MRHTLVHTALVAVFAATATMASFAVAAPPTNSAVAEPFAAPPATAPGKNKLLCFDGPSEDTDRGGLCRRVGRGAMGPVILDLTADDPEGSFAGVYYQESKIFGAALDDIKQLRFHYKATDDEIVEGNLSLNIPIDLDGDGAFEPEDAANPEQYAKVDVFYCPGTDGVVDAIEDDECVILYDGDEYENWDAFVEALVEEFPEARVATDRFAFIMARRMLDDGPASYRVNAVKIGKPGR